jgi:hypothetical protein
VATLQSEDCRTRTPASIVRLNRATIVVGVLLALLLRVPLVSTLLFAVVLSAALFGRRASLIYAVGVRVFKQMPEDPLQDEDPRLMRFNNALAALFLGIAQLAFLANVPFVRWVFAALTAVAATVALAGFCFGCFLFYQFKLNQARLFGMGS